RRDSGGMPAQGRGFSRRQSELRGPEQDGPSQGGFAELRFYGNPARRRRFKRSRFERDRTVSRRPALGEITQDDSARHGSPASQSSRRGFFRLGPGARQLPRNRSDRRPTGWRRPEQSRRSRQ